jgi:DNA-directed RNA polymerase specialized sigma24 family protein
MPLRRHSLSMKSAASGIKDRSVSREAFDQMLAWLDSDRERAGQKYEEIRCGLIKIFVCQGCIDPEGLADETIDRVIRKVPEIVPNYDGNPALYFSGVARYILLEYKNRMAQLRLLPFAPPKQIEEDDENIEREYECLDHCIERLTPANRELILEYYREEKQAMIENRKRLAERMRVTPNALRVRADRIRNNLQKCVANCLKQKGTNTQ